MLLSNPCLVFGKGVIDKHTNGTTAGQTPMNTSKKKEKNENKNKEKVRQEREKKNIVIQTDENRHKW